MSAIQVKYKGDEPSPLSLESYFGLNLSKC